MSPINQLVRDFKEDTKLNRTHERLGQYFVNRYIKSSWPELFNERNDDVSIEIIKVWLEEHNYFTELPQLIKAKLTEEP